MSTIEKLKKFGGKQWEKEGRQRIYFNNLRDLFQEIDNGSYFVVAFYGTGSVSWAALDGKKISNTNASRLLSELDLGKFWFDVSKNKFLWRFRSTRLLTKDEIGEKLAAELTARLEETC